MDCIHIQNQSLEFQNNNGSAQIIEQVLLKLNLILTAIVEQKQQFKEHFFENIKSKQIHNICAICNTLKSKSNVFIDDLKPISIQIKSQIVQKMINEKRKKLKIQNVYIQNINLNKQYEKIKQTQKYKSQRTQRYIRNSSQGFLHINRRFSQYPQTNCISILNAPNISPEYIEKNFSPFKMLSQKKPLRDLLGKQNYLIQKQEKQSKKIQRKGLKSLIRSRFQKGQILDLKYKKINMINDQSKNQNKLTYIASKEMGAMKKKWII